MAFLFFLIRKLNRTGDIIRSSRSRCSSIPAEGNIIDVVENIINADINRQCPLFYIKKRMGRVQTP